MQLQIRYKHEAVTKSWLQLLSDFGASLEFQNSVDLRSYIKICFQRFNDNLSVEVLRLNIFRKSGLSSIVFELGFDILPIPTQGLIQVSENFSRYFKVCFEGIHVLVRFGPDKGFSFNYFLLEERNQNVFAEPLRYLWNIIFQFCNDGQKLLYSHLKVFL